MPADEGCVECYLVRALSKAAPIWLSDEIEDYVRNAGIIAQGQSGCSSGLSFCSAILLYY